MKFARRFWFAGVLLLISQTPAFAASSNLGVGVILGDPTGLTFTHRFSTERELRPFLAYDWGNSFEIGVDYRFRRPGAGWLPQELKSTVPFFGIGARIENDNQFGLRLPVGLQYRFAGTPSEVGLELVPGIGLAPDTEAHFEGGFTFTYFLE